MTVRCDGAGRTSDTHRSERGAEIEVGFRRESAVDRAGASTVGHVNGMQAAAVASFAGLPWNEQDEREASQKR